MSSTSQAFEFLISALFEAAILLFLFRFLLQAVEVDFYNPLTQFVVKFTKPVLKPLSFIPTINRWNLAALLIMLLLESINIIINVEVEKGFMPFIPGILLWALGDLAYYFVHLFFYAIFAMAILSWLKPAGGNALMEVLHKITMPLMRPVRRIMPSIGGVDLTPIPVLIGLKFFSILLITPVIATGMRLAAAG